MINHISERLCSVSSAMPSPSRLIDSFLDQIEKLGAVLLPSEAERLQPIRIKARID